MYEEGEERVAHLCFDRVTPYGVATRHVYALCKTEQEAATLVEQVESNDWLGQSEMGIHDLHKQIESALHDGHAFTQATTEVLNTNNNEWCIEGSAVSVDD